VDGKRLGTGGVLTSDSSDSDDDRSATSGGTRATGSGGETDTAETMPLPAACALVDSAKARGWSAAPFAVGAYADLRFFGHSLEGGYVRSLRAGRAQTFGATTIGARS